MRRRSLLESTLAAGAAAFAAAAAARAQDKPAAKATGKAAKPEIYELRTYRMRIGGQPAIVGEYLEKFYLPLATRLGVGPVGTFTLTFGQGLPSLYVLTPCASLAAYQTLQAAVAEELPRSKLPAAAAFYNATADKPAYLRCENQLLVAFDNLPRIAPPAETAKKAPRIFELRVYETPTDAALAKKIEMFGDKMGELDIFRRVGLHPVFFGRTLVGPQQPGFSYLLGFPDLAARQAAWQRFREDAAWLKLKATPGYVDAEIMANITDYILSPTTYSQI